MLFKSFHLFNNMYTYVYIGYIMPAIDFITCTAKLNGCAFLCIKYLGESLMRPGKFKFTHVYFLNWIAEYAPIFHGGINRVREAKICCAKFEFLPSRLYFLFCLFIFTFYFLLVWPKSIKTILKDFSFNGIW